MASLAAKESIAGTIVTYIGVGIGFLTTFFILAKFLTPEEIGLTRLLPELATQLAGLGMLGMTYSISRYFPFFRDEPLSQGRWTSSRLPLLSHRRGMYRSGRDDPPLYPREGPPHSSL